MAAPFSGASRELGRQMKIGVETGFDQINDAGGVNGRSCDWCPRTTATSRRAQPTRCRSFSRRITPSASSAMSDADAAVALPFASSITRRFRGLPGAVFFVAIRPIADVFTYRASYAEETDAVVRYW